VHILENFNLKKNRSDTAEKKPAHPLRRGAPLTLFPLKKTSWWCALCGYLGGTQGSASVCPCSSSSPAVGTGFAQSPSSVKTVINYRF
jgi:hypothetical protein